MYPSGQVYSIFAPIVLFDPTMLVFSDLSGLPHIDGSEEEGDNFLLLRTREISLNFPINVILNDKRN